MVRRLAVSIAFLLAAPASAQAADLGVTSGVLRYTAAAGKVSNVTFLETAPNSVTVERFPLSKDSDPITPGPGCSPGAGNTAICSGVTSAAIDAGDQSDRIAATYETTPDVFAGLTTIPVAIAGGDGNDALVGGARGDTIEGGAGNDDIDGSAGNDSLRGGDGHDFLQPDNGTDTMIGGDGVDTAAYGRRVTPTFTLDGLANDGAAAENDLIGTDVENVEGSADDAAQTVTIIGDGRGNRLTVTFGKANITGGEGPDILEGSSQDDTIIARDGSPDTVICNGGTDTVLVDTLDTVSPSCENVQTQPTPGGPFDDHPPTLAWTAPGAGASISANAATTLSVDAADDRGLTRVQFFDDERKVCDDTSAPYTCVYQPRGADVGRNTLVAVATDGANQTSSAIRTVNVRRFTPKELGLSLHPSRDRRAPYAFRASGRVLRPEQVSPSQGCSGTITLTAKRGSKVVSTKRATLSRTCQYRATFSFRTRVASRLRLQAKFGGNEILSKDSSKTRTARLG
jgi:hypothetical protein